MSKCGRCSTERQTVMIDDKQLQVCMHAGCIMDKMIEQYEGCAHDFEVQGEHYLKCRHCGMGATPSYIQ